jgi:hypothetical protein
MIRPLAYLSRLVAGVAAVAAISLGLLASPAQAATPSATVQAVPVPMVLDCVHLTGGARTYAADHGYCTVAGASAGTVTPLGRNTGTCGDSWLYLTRIGPGVGRFTYGFLSSQGVVVARARGSSRPSCRAR